LTVVDEPVTAPSPLPPGVRLARATAIGLLLAMPAALANVALAAQDPKPVGLLNLTFLVMTIGFFVAGTVAGGAFEQAAAKRGTTAALLAFAIVQVVGILGRLDRGEPIRPVAIVLFGLFAACAGAMGGQFGAARRARRALKGTP
jgi:hypothetical protein